MLKTSDIDWPNARCVMGNCVSPRTGKALEHRLDVTVPPLVASDGLELDLPRPMIGPTATFQTHTSLETRPHVQIHTILEKTSG